MDDKEKVEAVGDGRPVEVREGQEPEPDAERDEDLPDESTVENVGY